MPVKIRHHHRSRIQITDHACERYRDRFPKRVEGLDDRALVALITNQIADAGPAPATDEEVEMINRIFAETNDALSERTKQVTYLVFDSSFGDEQPVFAIAHDHACITVLTTTMFARNKLVARQRLDALKKQEEQSVPLEAQVEVEEQMTDEPEVAPSFLEQGLALANFSDEAFEAVEAIAAHTDSTNAAVILELLYGALARLKTERPQIFMPRMTLDDIK